MSVMVGGGSLSSCCEFGNHRWSSIVMLMWSGCDDIIMIVAIVYTIYTFKNFAFLLRGY